jgi:hypothetical protein
VPHERAIRREQKIRVRLGGGHSILDPLPPKPKGMHWRTYAQCAERIAQGGADITKGWEDAYSRR